jgi:TolB-like protein/Tfp pilus assembly protein PilF
MTENAVFLSYASQDAAAALTICKALRAAGIEVWFDQSELRGGDAWDASIRQQIRACALFIPVISAHTRMRAEGYFRLEWKLAVDRSYLIAAEKAFLLPVVIDDTNDRDALVPDRFREVQWTRLPGGETSAPFVERVARLISPDAAPAQHARTQPHADAAAAPHAPGAAADSRAPSRPASKALWLCVVLVGLAAGYFVLDRFVPSKRSAQTAAATPTPQSTLIGPGAISEKSIAVLPFVNMSSDKEQEYFSDGLAEELLDLLAKTPGLHVIARTSSFSFKGKSEDIPTIAAKLRVANILEGSVRKSGNHLRVTTQLIRADTGEHVWSETYDRELKDVFKVQDEIAGAVVAALKLRLAPAQDASAHGTTNTEAYNQYLLGRQFWNRRTLDGYHHAVESYGKAIALDPDYAAAYAGLAMAQRYVADATGDVAVFKLAQAAADKAVTLAPEQADGYTARGYMRTVAFDWSGAEADLAKAIALNPGDSIVQRRNGELLAALGRLPEAIGSTKKAIELDPLSEPAWQTLEQYFMSQRDFAAAHEANRRALEINPESAYALNDLGTMQLLEGNAADAEATFSKVNSDAFHFADLAMAEHALGHARESQQALDQAIARFAQEAAYQISEVYAWRGERDKAFEWLDRSYRQQDGGLISIKYDPLFDGLRDDPRYRSMLRKLNLPD